MAKNTGQTVKVVPEQQTVDIGDPRGIYTLANDGADTVFYRQASTEATLIGDAATIRALPCGELKIGEPMTVFGVSWDIACATGEAADVRVLPGSMAASVNTTVSGVTLNSDLDKIAGTAVNVSSGAKNNGTLVVNQASDGVVADLLTATGATDVSVATAGGEGSMSAKLRLMTSQIDLLLGQLDGTPIKAKRIQLGASATLQSLMTEAFPAALTSIAIVPDDSTDSVYFSLSGGTASATTEKWPGPGFHIPMTKAHADEMTVFGTTKVTVYTFGPRN